MEYLIFINIALFALVIGLVIALFRRKQEPVQQLSFPSVIELKTDNKKEKAFYEREKVKFVFDNFEYEVYAVAEHREENKIEEIAANYTSDLPDAQERFRNLIATKDRYALQCAKRDEKNNLITGDSRGMYLLDPTHPRYSVYCHFRNLIETCYSYAKLKTLLIKYPEGFDLDRLSTDKFMRFRSAYEVALEKFWKRNRAA